MPSSTDAKAYGLGRLPGHQPVAVVDIGSNSVRLVVYERNSRAPAVLFNEKVLSGLGKGIAQTGRLNDEAVASAVGALGRFRALCRHMGVSKIHPIATAAAREAENGPEFIEAAEAAIGCEIVILSGQDEARYAAEGVIAGFHEPDGIAGDLGGGSLELVTIDKGAIGEGVTMPLGGLRLQDMAGGNLSKARSIADKHLAALPFAAAGKGRPFFAVGGTWRNLAKLHIEQSGYPLHVMHGYAMRPADIAGFLKDVAAGDPEKLAGIRSVARSRRPLLAYGAVALQSVIARLDPSVVILSATGVREGYLHALLPDAERERDPLIEAAEELSLLRSRSPLHQRELVDWASHTFAAFGIEESTEERRLREAACLIADVSWRAHPDYRGRQSLQLVVHSNLPAVDHPGRTFLGLTNYFRYEGTFDQDQMPALERLIEPRLLERARILASLFRVAYLLTGGMPGILPALRWEPDGKGLALVFPPELADIVGERPLVRLGHFAKATGRELRAITR
ncbi:Ppx/GppA phosphatase family protein [Aureimonas mangrovi]|uniref:Ppx/GppA phosphatase family protein n=1 Tax=Aureimonas mangrovi TaxID=2758041 RepID=UPI00163D6506|nr:Ppx/GppA phosphatase family protein [Aureimonas mangrovi]